MVGVAACGTVNSIKALWETRIRKVQEEEKEEARRRKTKGGVTGRLDTSVWEDRLTLAKLKEKLQSEEGRLILRIEQEDWKSLPDCLVQLPHVQEWQIHRTGLQTIPSFISRFQNLLVLDLSRNGISNIPRQIGELPQLKELLLSYNRIQLVPEELGCCQSLERLELAMNRNLDQLPNQLRNLKKLQHLDLSMNNFTRVPDCVVGMPMLEWLDMGGNHLQHLPEDIHRCEGSAATCSGLPPAHHALLFPLRMEKLHTLWLQRNQLETLPENISRMASLDTLVLSSNKLTDIPQLMEDMSNLRFVNFRDNPLTLNVTLVSEKTETQEEDDREMFGREFMLTYIQEARKRSHAILHMHRVATATAVSAAPVDSIST
ncbi:leucine-rich repeat-containing protein 39 isoform X1 [Takifugu flavidus]|uniref:leucine-rich repeat-containing protein 39 isoform X1 n=1 Tax=Takifugu flavidus TaxID=433684 RepID=UPI002544B72F|nr:leucine-rich repeat-containing protein 39 isoform X1 [Takifugu flavidus]XP_056894372.1 leucine-rich repeat-containing protein 39 isoform X1 [Takifugu flavidus]